MPNSTRRADAAKAALAVALVPLLAGETPGQVHDGEPFEPFDWPSRPPADCPFEPSEELVGITFTGRHREYVSADCWFLSWASDGKLYSSFSDGSVENVGPDGTVARIETWGQRGEDATVGYGVVVGDDPMNLKVTGLGALPTPTGPFAARYPSGQLVHDGVWYLGSHPEGGAALVGPEGAKYEWPWVLPFVGFRISRDFGATWSDGPNDPTRPLFDELGALPDGEPRYGPIQIGEPWFVDFGKNMEHSPDGKAYLVAHGGTERRGDPVELTASWCIGDHAYLLRVVPSPKTINDAGQYEFFAGHDSGGQPVWTRDRTEMRPLIDWSGRVGSAAITYDAPLQKYLFCVTDGRAADGPYDTYILESDHITGPWKLVAFLEDFGEQAYFVNIPSRFIGEDGRTLWLCYSANFSGATVPLESNPPGSRYGLNLQEIRLRAKERDVPNTTESGD